jgi:ribonuclease D
MDDAVRFGPGFPTLADYERLTWSILERHVVEFFPGSFFEVTLISTEVPNFVSYLSNLADGAPMAIDLEWEEELCLLQFCSSKGCLIIRHPPGRANRDLRDFLRGNRFYGKGMHNDKAQLKAKFGEDLCAGMEDIAKTRLAPYGHSQNFQQMTIQFAGQPTAEFKDIRITKSNWGIDVLTFRQVLYAAFDVVALYCCSPHSPWG